MVTQSEQRKSVDCRMLAPATNRETGQACSLKISGNADEVLAAAVDHAVRAHGEQDTPELRQQIQSMIKEEAYC